MATVHLDPPPTCHQQRKDCPEGSGGQATNQQDPKRLLCQRPLLCEMVGKRGIKHRKSWKIEYDRGGHNLCYHLLFFFFTKL